MLDFCDVDVLKIVQKEKSLNCVSKILFEQKLHVEQRVLRVLYSSSLFPVAAD